MVAPNRRHDSLFLAMLAAALGCSSAGQGASTDDLGSTSSGESASQGGSGSTSTGGSGGSSTGGSASTAGGSGPAPSDAWAPPIGIPEPSFGIHEKWDTTCASCALHQQDDLSGLEGIAPGTVVEISGGPFDGSAPLTISGVGTARQPIFVRGPSASSKTVIHRAVEIQGSYIVVENIDFDFALQDRRIDIAGDHIALRASDVHRFRPDGFSTTVVIAESSDVVIYDSRIFDNGDFEIGGEMDVHGIGANHTWGVWIVDSILHHNRGDSFQAGHQAANSVGDIYIGRNDMHEEGENCVDIKEASNVVVSQNVLHTAGPYSEGAVVFHDCPLNAAAIFNEVYGRPYGQSMASLEDVCAPHRPVQLFSIGNTFHDIAGAAVQGWGSGKQYWVAGNEFAQVADTISIENAAPGSVITEGDDGFAAATAAFHSVYGIDISAGEP